MKPLNISLIFRVLFQVAAIVFCFEAQTLSRPAAVAAQTVAPTTVTGSVTNLSATTATFNGSAIPNGGATTGWFRYSTTNPGTCNDNFGTRAPISGGSALGSGNTGVSYQQVLTGLSPQTTYYFCAIASNSNGVGFGSVLSFTTPCGVVLTPSSQYFSSAAGSGAFNISAVSTCSWTAVSNVPWVTITSNPPSGSGNGVINYSVPANPDPFPRTGTITIGDQIFTVSQSSAGCIPVLQPGGSLPGGTTGSFGIGVADLTGQGFVSFSVTLTYDPAIVSFDSVDNIGTLSSNFTVGGNVTSPGTVRIAGFGTSPLAGNGNLINLRFTAVGAIGSTSPINFTAFQFNEGGCTQWPSFGGGIIVTGRTVSGSVLYGTAPTPFGVAGVQIVGGPNLTLTDSNGAFIVTGLGVGFLQLIPLLQNDPLVNGITSADASLVLQAVLGTATLTAEQAIAGDVSGNGSVTPFDAALIARYAVGLPNTVFAGTWRFSPAQRTYASLPNDLTGQDFALILMGDVTGNWTPPAAPGSLLATTVSDPTDKTTARNAIKLSLPLINRTAGIAVIPVTLANYNGQIITSYQFDVRFDPAVLEPDVSPIDTTATLSNGFSYEFNAAQPGLLRIAVYGIQSIPSNGTLVNLRFNVIGPPLSRSDLRFENAMLNEGNPSVTVQNGRVTVKR